MSTDGYLFPTAGFVLRSLLDALDESGQQWTEPQAAADIMLALDRGEVKPYRYYADRWGWSKSRVYRNMDDLKARARSWRQFQSRESEDDQQPEEGPERNAGGTERNAGGTERNAGGTERNAETCLAALKADFGTRAGHCRTQAGQSGTQAGQRRDSIEQITETDTETDKTPTPPTARARGDGAPTDTEPDPPEPSPTEEGRDPWWFLPERDSVYRPEMEQSAERYSETSLDQIVRRHWGGYRQGKVPLSSLSDLLDQQQSEYGDEEGFRRLVAGIVISAGEADTPGLKFLKSVLDNLDHFRQEQDEQRRDDSRQKRASQPGGRAGGDRRTGAPPDRGGAW